MKIKEENYQYSREFYTLKKAEEDPIAKRLGEKWFKFKSQIRVEDSIYKFYENGNEGFELVRVGKTIDSIYTNAMFIPLRSIPSQESLLNLFARMKKHYQKKFKKKKRFKNKGYISFLQASKKKC